MFGQETREIFLRKHLLHYDVMEYINTNLSDDVKIFTMFLGRRGYYLDRTYRNERSFGMDTLNKMITSSTGEEKFKEYIKSMGVTHILIRTDLVDKYLKDNFSAEEIKRFLSLENKYWRKVYENNGYVVWDIQLGR